jgi:hypothetical protein
MKRRQFWHKQFHVLSADVFKTDVGLAVNMTRAEVERAVRRKCTDEALLKPWLEAIAPWDEETQVRGSMTLLGGGFVVLMKADKNNFREAVGTLVHEMTHVTQYLLRHRRIPLNEDTEEVHAYLVEHLVHNALRRMY